MFPVLDSRCFLLECVRNSTSPSYYIYTSVSSLKLRPNYIFWRVNVRKVIYDILSCYTVKLGVSLWKGLKSNNVASQISSSPSCSSEIGSVSFIDLELEKTKSSGWHMKAWKRIRLSFSFCHQPTWHMNMFHQILMLRILRSVVFGTVGTWGAWLQGNVEEL